MILQRICVGGFQLGELPPIQHATRQFVFGREVFKYVCTRRICACFAFLAAL